MSMFREGSAIREGDIAAVRQPGLIQGTNTTKQNHRTLADKTSHKPAAAAGELEGENDEGGGTAS